MSADPDIDWQAQAMTLFVQLEGLAAAMEEATKALDHLNNVKDAARHLLKVMALRGGDDLPIFTLTEPKAGDLGSEANTQMLVHAVYTLHAVIEGTPLPNFCIDQGVFH